MQTPWNICFFVYFIISFVRLCINLAHIFTQECHIKGSNINHKITEIHEKVKEFIQQVLSYLDFLLFLHNSKNTHDRWILRGGLFVLFEISFQHIFFFLHLLLDLFIKVLISFVVTLSYFFVVCHNYKIIINTYSFAISNESCKRYKKNNQSFIENYWMHIILLTFCH